MNATEATASPCKAQGFCHLPDGLVAGFALTKLPARWIFFTAIACVKLCRCTGYAIEDIARTIGLRRLEGETAWDLLRRSVMHVGNAVGLRRREAEGFGSFLFSIRAMSTTRLWEDESKRVPLFDGNERGPCDVLTFGDNCCAQLGHGPSFQHVDIPLKVDALDGKNVSIASFSNYNAVFLLPTGEVFILGKGELGSADHLSRVDIPTQESRVAYLATGVVYTTMITRDGVLLIYGSSESWLSRQRAVLATDPSVGIGIDMEIEASPPPKKKTYLPRMVLGGSHKKVARIAVGVNHMAMIILELCAGQLVTKVFTVGHGKYGKLGHGTEKRKNKPSEVLALRGKIVVEIAAGENHTAVLTNEGVMYTFGCGKCGQLGHSGSNNKSIPCIVGALTRYRVLQIAAGREHTGVLTSTGKVFMFGRGEYGQLGSGDTKNRYVPRRLRTLEGFRVVQVAAGHYHTVLLTHTGQVYTFGLGHCGQLGHGGVANELTPRLVDKLVGKCVVQLAAGGHHTAVFAEQR